eukprot:m.315391 g.315391  ORF g.315391 m.315391 type:complete len:284 (-) comp27521_c0_seq11:225-1076(-)
MFVGTTRIHHVGYNAAANRVTMHENFRVPGEPVLCTALMLLSGNTLLASADKPEEDMFDTAHVRIWSMDGTMVQSFDTCHMTTALALSLCGSLVCCHGYDLASYTDFYPYKPLISTFEPNIHPLLYPFLPMRSRLQIFDEDGARTCDCGERDINDDMIIPARVAVDKQGTIYTSERSTEIGMPMCAFSTEVAGAPRSSFPWLMSPRPTRLDNGHIDVFQRRLDTPITSVVVGQNGRVHALAHILTHDPAFPMAPPTFRCYDSKENEEDDELIALSVQTVLLTW